MYTKIKQFSCSTGVGEMMVGNSGSGAIHRLKVIGLSTTEAEARHRLGTTVRDDDA